MNLAALLLAVLPALLAAQNTPAFPGAEGFGSRTAGGRGGEVRFVTNLNDSGPGSLRAACEAKGPRIVVFRVAGIIELKSPLRIREPNLTIAAQSAPGDGVCLRGYAVSIDTHDVIVRHLRVRTGDTSGKEQDGLAVGGTSRNVILDHCSVSWAIDENLSPSGAISDVTVQWCIIAEALNHSVHSKGAHGYGSLLRAHGGVSMHHNLWAHNSGRNPRFGDNYGKPPFPTLDIRNNVVYNFGGSNVSGDTLSVNYTGNYIKPGPNSRLDRGFINPTATSSSAYYMDGNYVEGHPELTTAPARFFVRMEADGRTLVTLRQVPFDAPKITATPAAEAFRAVLEGAGATVPARDPVDRRIVDEVRTGKGALIDSQWEVGGWPVYAAARPPLDSDRDGIPDAWETAHKLNPRDPKDAAADRDGDGYTNLEEYLNELADRTTNRAVLASPNP